MAERQHRTLSQVTGYIRKLVEDNLANKRFWLKVEVSNINFHRTSGHCYLGLVEHSDGRTIAECRGTIWSYNVVNIKNELGNDFSNILRQGSEILAHVEVSFTEVYGLSINILAVDKYLAYGNLEKKKQETIQRLTAEELIGKNKVHKLSIVIQNIALIGSNSTSGHADVVKQLHGNEFGYQFNIVYFQSSVQGEKAEKEILARLKELENSQFDVVLLVRGGGSKLDLEVFNSYGISKCIANHTKPILTGIGHETDTGTVDLVCNMNFKTPSAVGAFIVERNRNYDVRVQTSFMNIKKAYGLYIQQQKHRIHQGALNFKNSSISYTQLRRGKLHQIGNRVIALIQGELSTANEFLSSSKQVIKVTIPNSIVNKRNRLKEFCEIYQIKTHQVVDTRIKQHNHQMEMIKMLAPRNLKKQTDFVEKGLEIIELVHPDNVLERGYSITRQNGKFVNSNTKLEKGQTVEIELYDKRITATVVSVNLKNSKWKTLLTSLLPKS